MANDMKRRNVLAETASKMLRNPEVEYILPARMNSGERQVLIALSNDSYGDVLSRVQSIGGPVNVIVGDGSKKISVIIFTPSNHLGKKAESDSCDIGPTSEIGLLVELLESTRRMTQVKLATPTYETELVTYEMQ